MNCSARDAGKCGGFWGETDLERVQMLSQSTQQLCLVDVWESGSWTAASWNGNRQEVVPLAVVRALQLPWKRCEILNGDKYLVIWGLDGKMAFFPSTQHPRALNCYRRQVIIERGRYFLINCVNPAAAQPSCIFSNVIKFVAQFLGVLWATANLKKIQFYSFVALDLGQTTL